MTISRKLVASDDSLNQWLKVDHSSRYIQNTSPEWQFIFGPDSSLSTSKQLLKIAARFNDNTFNNIQLTSYLYNPDSGSISNASGCQFTITKVIQPDWSEQLITTLNGTQLTNNYFYINPTLSSLSLDFLGGDTLMIEAVITRLGITYRDRIYVNHLGIYDNVTRLRQDVEFLEVTKKDL